MIDFFRRLFPPAKPTYSALLAVVLQHGNDYAFFKSDAISDSRPILIHQPDQAEQQVGHIRKLLQGNDILFDHIFLFPEEINLRPLTDLSVHLAIVSVPESEMVRAKVSDFQAIPASQIQLRRDTNVFFEIVSRYHEQVPVPIA